MQHFEQHGLSRKRLLLFGFEVSQNVFEFLNNWEFNRDLTVNDLIKSLSAIKEVQRYEITLTTNDPDNSGSNVNARFNELIRPDQIDIAFVFV